MKEQITPKQALEMAGLLTILNECTEKFEGIISVMAGCNNCQIHVRDLETLQKFAPPVDIHLDKFNDIAYPYKIYAMLGSVAVFFVTTEEQYLKFYYQLGEGYAENHK
jgi:hypothetical protein